MFVLIATGSFRQFSSTSRLSGLPNMVAVPCGQLPTTLRTFMTISPVLNSCRSPNRKSGLDY